MDFWFGGWDLESNVSLHCAPKLNNAIIHKNVIYSARFDSTYTKIGTIQRRLAWPLHKDDTQIREAFHIFKKNNNKVIYFFFQ